MLPAYFLTRKQASGLFQKERTKRSASADVEISPFSFICD